MKEVIITKDDLPIVIKYEQKELKEQKEYVIKATPKGLLMIRKEY